MMPGKGIDRLRKKCNVHVVKPTIHTFNTWSLPEVMQQQRNYGATSRIKRKDHCGVPPLSKGDTMISDAPAKAKLLNGYFSFVFVKVLSHSFKAYQSL